MYHVFLYSIVDVNGWMDDGLVCWMLDFFSKKKKGSVVVRMDGIRESVHINYFCLFPSKVVE